jgi:hypothetical protein
MLTQTNWEKGAVRSLVRFIIASLLAALPQ